MKSCLWGAGASGRGLGVKWSRGPKGPAQVLRPHAGTGLGGAVHADAGLGGSRIRSGRSVGGTAGTRPVMPGGRSPSPLSSDSAHSASPRSPPTTGRRVRRRDSYVEVEVLADASHVAKEVTGLYDRMVDEVQAFSEKRYGGSPFALQVKELTLLMLKTTLTTRLQTLIAPDDQLARERRRIRTLRREVRALQAQEECRRSSRGRRSL